jgi:hypothetical protein
MTAFILAQTQLANMTHEHTGTSIAVGLILSLCALCGVIFLTGFLAYSWWENGFLSALAIFISMMTGGFLGGISVTLLGVRLMGLAAFAAIPICIYLMIIL